MAVQRRRIPNDLGSAVVEEMASQLNRAACSTPCVLSLNMGSAGAGVLGEASIVDTDNGAGPFFHATEDCLVTSVKIAFVGAILGTNGTPASTEFILLRVPASYDNGAGAAEDRLFPPTIGIHGNSNTVLGNANATYEVLFATDGTIFTAVAGFDDGQLAEMLGVAAGGGATAITADAFNDTMIAQDHAITPEVDAVESIRMAAGDSLVWGLLNNAGAGVSVLASVTYRPIKDQLDIVKSIPNKMRNFSVTPR